jgi:nuclear transport factor 2 (NTF2) superfamily protein
VALAFTPGSIWRNRLMRRRLVNQRPADRRIGPAVPVGSRRTRPADHPGLTDLGL